MEKRFPKADMDIVSSFASSVLPKDSNDLAHVLLITASRRLWKIFHTLLEMGLSPLNAHVSDFHYENDDKFLALRCHKTSYLSNVLLILVAAGGDISVMSYVLSLQHQIGYSRVVFCWLPYSAMLHGSHVLANWLLLNLPFEIKEYLDAIKLLALHSLKGPMFDEFLAYINDVLRRCPESDLEDLFKQCFLQNLQNKQVLEFLLTDSRLPSDALTAVAKRYLPHFAGKQDHFTVKLITSALEDFDQKSITVLERRVQEMIKDSTFDQVAAVFNSNMEYQRNHALVYRALQTAARTGKLDVLEYLFSIQPAANQAITNHLSEILYSAFKSGMPDVVLCVNSHADKINEELYLDHVFTFFCQVFSRSEIHDAVRVLKAEQSGPYAREVPFTTAIAAIYYSTERYFSTVLSYLQPYMDKVLIIQLLSNILNSQLPIDDLRFKCNYLINELGTDVPEYVMFLKENLTQATTSNSFNRARFLVQYCKWPNEETREACFLQSARIACEHGNNRLLCLFIYEHGHVSEAERMALPYHADTWRTALSGISTDKLLAAQMAAAESNTGANYELVRHGLLSSNPTEAQMQMSNVADVRHVEFLLGKLQTDE